LKNENIDDGQRNPNRYQALGKKAGSVVMTNKQLNDYINNLDGYEKLYGQADEAFCLIFKKNVGQPF
jgi:hypothetical protein